MKRGRKKRAIELKPVLLAGVVVVAMLAIWFLIEQNVDLVGEAWVGAQNQGPGKCACSFSSQHTRLYISTLPPGKRMEFADNDAHARAFSKIKSDVVQHTETFELDLSNHLKGLFVIGEDPGQSRVFRGVCSQAGRYTPKAGCTSNNDCQQLCPQVPGIGELIAQVEMDCAEYITRGFTGIIQNKLGEGEVSLFVERDLDDVSVKGTCELGATAQIK